MTKWIRCKCGEEQEIYIKSVYDEDGAPYIKCKKCKRLINVEDKHYVIEE